MKIKISEDYQFIKDDIDRLRRNPYDEFTYGTLEPTWETIEVTFEELQELIKQGKAIKINC